MWRSSGYHPTSHSVAPSIKLWTDNKLPWQDFLIFLSPLNQMRDSTSKIRLQPFLPTAFPLVTNHPVWFYILRATLSKLTNLMDKIFFYFKFIIRLYMFRALCAHHQEVKIVLYSTWYHHTCRWPSCAQVHVVLETCRGI